VGKAVSLRKRVASYFRGNNPPKTEALAGNICDIEYIECVSEAQALLLESALIKEKQPKFNVELKDAKSYPFLEVSREEFPRIFISRPRDKEGRILLGPYTDAGALKEVMKLVRRIFPYRSCVRLSGKPCLYFHLKLCPAPCAGYISPDEYEKTVNGIRKVLEGRRRELEEDLERQMREASGRQLFEKAAGLRDKLTALQNLYAGCQKPHELSALKDILNLPSMPLNIEAFDISNLSGTSAVGSLVSFRDGKPDKNNYRRFRIKSIGKIDDYAMLGEVLRRRYRRLLKNGAGLPDLVIVDGGRGHVRRAKEELDRLGLALPVVGIAKQNEEIWFPLKSRPLIIPRDNPALKLIQRMRDEAHRFARKYHVLLRKKKLLNKNDC
jgi:excinuclease ABC subunit C